MNGYQLGQHKDGFTFAEVIIAVMVIGLLLTTLLQTQTGLITMTSASDERMHRAMHMWNAIVYAWRQEWYQQEQEQQDNFYTDEVMQYQYQQQSLDEQSVLAPYAQTLTLERFIGRDDNEESQMIMYRYQPPQQEASE